MTWYLNFFILAFIAAFTPGPNNSMLMQSGIYFGLRNTLRHINGVIAGFGLLFFFTNMGLYALIIRFPVLNIVLKSLGTVYFTYLAWRVFNMTPPETTDETTLAHTDTLSKRRSKKPAKPLGFIGAFLFQWINIKAWFFAISAVGSLPSERTLSSGLLAQLIILIVSAGSTLAWTLGGVYIASILKNPLHLKIINTILALSLVYITVDQWF